MADQSQDGSIAHAIVSRPQVSARIAGHLIAHLDHEDELDLMSMRFCITFIWNVASKMPRERPELAAVVMTPLMRCLALSDRPDWLPEHAVRDEFTFHTLSACAVLLGRRSGVM